MPVYKIAIAGASTLLGRELKEVLSESPLASANLRCSTKKMRRASWTRWATRSLSSRPSAPTPSTAPTSHFSAAARDLTRRHWQQALRAGSTVFDLSGALDQEPGVLIRAPWLGTEAAAVDLFTPAVVPAHPAVIALALLLQRLQQAAPVRFAAATVLEPASEFGRAAMDELHQQTVSLLSFQSLPRAFYDAQAAYNLLGGMGEGSKVNLHDVEARIRRHYEALTGGRGPALAVQVIHAPVFHGLAFSIAVELERPVEIVALEEALTGEHVELVLEDTDSPSNLAATGQNDILVRLRPEPLGRNSNQASRLWLWAAADNLALECAKCRSLCARSPAHPPAGHRAVTYFGSFRCHNCTM